MLPDEKKALSALLARALKDEHSFYFRDAGEEANGGWTDVSRSHRPGNPDLFRGVSAGAGTLLMVSIPQEDARDLSLIKSNLDKGRYTMAKQVDDDIDLMLENARVFNAEGEVVEAANAFARWWKAQKARLD
jgi:hypothetical protein